MSSERLLSWIVVALVSGVCKAEQRFSETPATYQEVSSGDDVQLRCRVQDKKGQCIWQKDRKPVGMHPDKYEWVGGRESDCTLLIRRASLHFDDGFWECQVTPGDFTRQDALTSLPARLLVRGKDPLVENLSANSLSEPLKAVNDFGLPAHTANTGAMLILTPYWIKPRKPLLEYGGAVLNSVLTLREGQEATLSCVSRYGNPPALIKWFIGGDEVEALREQTNATEVDNPKTWAAHSIIHVRGQRENHGLPIRCLTLHPSSPLPAIAESRLDIHYSPEVMMETSPRLLATALEDSASFMSLKCIADANPTATVKWFKDATPITNSNNIVLLMQNRTHQNGTWIGSELRFEPVKKEDAGLYSCKASNTIGESPPANYRIDVQYGPRLKVKDANNFNLTFDEVEESALLGTPIEPFECAEFEANPPPQFRWIHLRGGTTEMLENIAQNMDAGRRLRLKHIMWSDEGEYRCVAFNSINGVRREMPHDTRFILHVTGPPEIQTRASSDGKGFYESIGWAGEPVHRLKSRFCSQPPPRLVAWQWGSSHIRAGESIQQKYEALPLEPITENKMITNCYWAKLEIKDLQKEDARVYTLLVESEKGRDSTNVKLIVRDPTEMRVIAAAAAVGLLLLLLLISVGVYSILRAKHRQYRQEEGEGSIAADAFYSTATSMEPRKTVNSPQNKTLARKTNHEGGLAIMYDYDQIAKQDRTMSPEALKVRRAPAVLQPPTIV